MGKRTVDDASLTALAEAIREQTGDPGELIFPAGFMAAAHTIRTEGYSNGHADGMKKGAEEEAAVCTGRHFVQTFVGDGGTSYSFHVPFEPDFVYIFGLDPNALKTNYQLMTVYCDLRAFGMVGGFAHYGDTAYDAGGNAAYTTAALTAADLPRYSRAEDGTVTVANIGPTRPIARTVTFGDGVPYTVVATKHIEQTDKERITDFVNGLTGSGSVTLNQEKVNAAFSDTEWAELIEEKSGWTFSWI